MNSPCASVGARGAVQASPNAQLAAQKGLRGACTSSLGAPATRLSAFHESGIPKRKLAAEILNSALCTQTLSLPKTESVA